MYLVLFLTVFVDLITAVLVGAFIANILTIKRLSDEQSENIKAITDPSLGRNLTLEEQTILTQANGDILMLQLGGPMSFGAAKSISRRMAMVKNYHALVLDLSEVPSIGVTATLAIESIIQDALKHHRHVWIVAISSKVQTRLKSLELEKFAAQIASNQEQIPPQFHQIDDRLQALRSALLIVTSSPILAEY